jgi:hypothetical protein
MPRKPLIECNTNSVALMTQCSSLLKNVSFVFFQLLEGDVQQHKKVNVSVVLVSGLEKGRKHILKQEEIIICNMGALFCN